MSLKELRPLKKGEYDLVNICVLGSDPITGRPFNECNAEWQAWLDEAQERQKNRRWWDIVEWFRIVRITQILHQRMGF
jgi:hypothetical protein